MCGIAGFVGNFSSLVLQRMNRSQFHRGPDDHGIWYDKRNKVGLAHRRLSIIDLSDNAQQPLFDINHNAVIVFNGEIYNYRELKRELEKDGFFFHSSSDTEVLINLYIRDGKECLNKLNGIFAFALWDTFQKKLFIARDHFGIKPFYYCNNNNGFIFSSELKALLTVSEINKDIDPLSILYYMTFIYGPYPCTPLKAVKKLPPGNAGLLDLHGNLQIWKFYKVPYKNPIRNISVDSAAIELKNHLSTAVKRQLISDVPVGAFLSGGLDSSAIAYFAKDHFGSKILDCFTIRIKGYQDSSEGITDDLPYAKKIAKFLNLKLHIIEIGSDIAEKFEDMIYHLDEPQADPASLNVLFICQLARSYGFKVLLSGAGGDDIFSGYRRHYALMKEKYWSWMPLLAKKNLAKYTQKITSNHFLGRRIRKAFQYSDLPANKRICSYFFWLHPDWIIRLAGDKIKDEVGEYDPYKPLLHVLGQLPEKAHPLNKMLALDGSYFLTDHNLNYTDKMSMAKGVEVRVPFLDLDLVKFAASLPPEFKQRGGTGKWIFKKAMEPYLPKEVIYRPKTGFGAPIRSWLRNDLKEYTEDLLSTNNIKERGLFNPKFVQEFIALDRAGRVDGAYTIFSMMCIELWCRLFLDS